MASPITITQKGSFKNTEHYLARMSKLDLTTILAKYGEMGVVALSNATPHDSGLAANSWYYDTEVKKGYYSIRWYNSDTENGFHVAIMIQYGHGTGTGGYVPGRDYVMPAMRPIFEQIAAEAAREVTKI